MKELTTVPIIVLFFILFGCGTASSLNTTGEKKSKPNIILILADDLGYMDTQCYAEKMLGTAKEKMFYETPNIDRLVDEGISFSRAYANQLCNPGR